eukprot:475382-Pleurochrysis_carterae.AAC.1
MSNPSAFLILRLSWCELSVDSGGSTNFAVTAIVQHSRAELWQRCRALPISGHDGRRGRSVTPGRRDQPDVPESTQPPRRAPISTGWR